MFIDSKIYEVYFLGVKGLSVMWSVVFGYIYNKVIFWFGKVFLCIIIGVGGINFVVVYSLIYVVVFYGVVFGIFGVYDFVLYVVFYVGLLIVFLVYFFGSLFVVVVAVVLEYLRGGYVLSYSLGREVGIYFLGM